MSRGQVLRRPTNHPLGPAASQPHNPRHMHALPLGETSATGTTAQAPKPLGDHMCCSTVHEAGNAPNYPQSSYVTRASSDPEARGTWCGAQFIRLRCSPGPNEGTFDS